MSVPASGNGHARGGASSEAEVNPRARRNPLKGAVSPRARRNPLEGGVDPRARPNLLEGLLVGHSGGPRGPTQCGSCLVCALK
jgi:hypothetical protein